MGRSSRAPTRRKTTDHCFDLLTFQALNACPPELEVINPGVLAHRVRVGAFRSILATQTKCTRSCGAFQNLCTTALAALESLMHQISSPRMLSPLAAGVVEWTRQPMFAPSQPPFENAGGSRRFSFPPPGLASARAADHHPLSATTASSFCSLFFFCDQEHRQGHTAAATQKHTEREGQAPPELICAPHDACKDDSCVEGTVHRELPQRAQTPRVKTGKKRKIVALLLPARREGAKERVGRTPEVVVSVSRVRVCFLFSFSGGKKKTTAASPSPVHYNSTPRRQRLRSHLLLVLPPPKCVVPRQPPPSLPAASGPCPSSQPSARQALSPPRRPCRPPGPSADARAVAAPTPASQAALASALSPTRATPSSVETSETSPPPPPPLVLLCGRPSLSLRSSPPSTPRKETETQRSCAAGGGRGRRRRPSPSRTHRFLSASSWRCELQLPRWWVRRPEHSASLRRCSWHSGHPAQRPRRRPGESPGR